ncbi:DUF485 domain-containing protein [Saccharopolyspora phatthalungensis]|uniref:Uncharacterized membrane protein (DUF485 family) n=1 Tax=Saccharopolyspora phatthalungensis TaxID=664693 RepID=A0A840Q9D8_9PSEU|nr:DUF485 domain-containing protein [Saccharopolyspora phatthalungensis]MBB5155278.1 uncharacterized membrane protein (DUF485 family) [Saccharopolyspora phatthalungensis]
MLNATQPPPRRLSDGRTTSTPTFGEIDKSAARYARPAPDYPGIARSPEFRDLRARLRRFVFPMSALFLIWYLGYVVIAAYLPEFMSIRLVGAVNIGLIMGIGQFVTTILITVLYLRYAARQIDPRVLRLYRNATGEEPR